MTGSVRGALSNERPYRDRAQDILHNLCKPDRARRAHAAMVGTARNPSSRAPVGGHGSRRMRSSALPSAFETPAAKPLPAPHRVRGESVARSSYGRVPLELNGRVGKGALCAPCPPLATDRVGTARAVKLA
jgi:hypothetical protein